MSSPRSRKPKVTERKREIPRPIHPFPARMAASIPWSELQGGKTSLRVLDPMAGSGTMVLAGLDHGASRVIGIDRVAKYLRVARRRIEEG